MNKTLKTLNEGFDRKYLKENLPDSLEEKAKLASNPNTPGSILTKLANDEAWSIR